MNIKNPCYLYGKMDGLKRFKPVSPSMMFETNLIYACCWFGEIPDKDLEKLKETARINSDGNLVFEIRDSTNGKKVWETKKGED